METKKSSTRFTIQFNRDNPLHIKVAEILNKQSKRGKARYIVDAVLHYENCDKTPNMSHTTQIDEKFIEEVVKRILRDNHENSTNGITASVPTGKVEATLKNQSHHTNSNILDTPAEEPSEDVMERLLEGLKVFDAQ